MKNKYLSKIIIAFLLLVSFSISSQNLEEIKQITKNYNQEKLNNLAEKFNTQYKKDRQKIEEYARLNNTPVRYTDKNGTLFEMKKITKNGRVIYNRTYNLTAGVSTRANYLHNGGVLGLNVEGQGMTAHVWDGGLARGTHQEYNTFGASSRFSIGDGTTDLHFHAAHVMGTIIAKGNDSNAKGMAPKAIGIGYDWNNDIGEAISAAGNGMLLSNHSYGYAINSIPNSWLGAYTSDARDWDVLMHNTPYYLMVVAAGNDGNNNTTNGNPLDGNSSYDKLSSHGVSKNSMVVANGIDANINLDGSLGFVTRNSSSSEGPTDDYRIKPDIMGNGTDVYSTFEDSDNSYFAITGTSMASPNVCGSLLLLQQHYNQENGSFMRAATLKGLALHTADNIDTGSPGPNAESGWGLMNTKAAAEAITTNGTQSFISEEELTDGETYTLTVQSNGTTPLLASISWTDLPGTVNNTNANDTTPRLVNDLDIRITQGTNTFMPWKLISVSTNTQADNIVDPFERVDVNAANGVYTITVVHKWTLTDGSQKFSLVVTGISSVLSVSEFDVKDLLIYPNPTTGIVNIQINSASNEDVLIDLHDVQGRKVFETKRTSTSTVFKNTVNFSAVANGVYLLKIQQGNKRLTKQIILNK